MISGERKWLRTKCIDRPDRRLERWVLCLRSIELTVQTSELVAPNWCGDVLDCDGESHSGIFPTREEAQRHCEVTARKLLLDDLRALSPGSSSITIEDVPVARDGNP